MIKYIRGPAYKTVPHFGGMTIATLRTQLPNLAVWGAAAGAGVAVFTSGIPLFDAALYSKIPFVGDYWVRNPDPEDVPV